MEKENLDNLFRESLDEFSQSPDPQVWERIEASLDQKARRRRRVVPLWWQLGGAAAALALLLFLLIPGDRAETVPQTDPITNTPVRNTPVEDPSKNPESVFETSKDPVDSESVTENVDFDRNAGQNQQDIAPNKAATAVASQENAPQETFISESVNPVASRETLVNPSGAAVGSDEISPANKTEIAEAVTSETETNTANPSQAEIVQSEELAQLEQKKAMDELLSGEQEEPLLEKDNAEGKWAIGPSVAPVYFNGLGDGSPIDQAFVSNEKTGSFNMSYGLQVSYQLNKRLQIRSGLHKVDFGYNTNDIVFSSSLQASSAAQMKNVDYSASSEYLVVSSQSLVPTKEDASIRNEIAARNTAREGTMVQEFGYLEVPFELNYALIDRTLGVHLISGISSLFLVDNMVSLESGTGTTEVGQANNLNEVNFSANFGLGVQYKVNDKIKLQVEPLLKYQLNTFSETAGDFRPYSIGIYSGIRYKF